MASISISRILKNFLVLRCFFLSFSGDNFLKIKAKNEESKVISLCKEV